MRASQSALIAQVCVFLLFVASTLAGSMTLVGHLWSDLPMPDALLVTVPGALALLLGGLMMMSLMLLWRRVQVISGGVLCLMGLNQLLHHVVLGPGELGGSWLTELTRLQTGPAVCVLLLGLLGVFGFERSWGRLYGRIVGVVGIAVGCFIWLQYWRGDGLEPNQLIYGFSRVVSLFGVGYGILLLVLPSITHIHPVRMGRMDAVVGAVGVLGTFILLVIASWGTYLQRQTAVQMFLQSQEVMFKGQLQESVELIERLADRWSALGYVVPPELMETELRRYLKDLPALKALVAFNERRDLLVLAGKSLEESSWTRQQLLDPAIEQWVKDVERQGYSYAWLVPDPQRPLSMLLMVIPQNPVKGWFFVSYDLGVMFKPMFELAQHEYQIRIETPTDQQDPPKITLDDHGLSARINLQVPHGPELVLVASASPIRLLSWQGALMPAILGFGLLVSFLLTVTSHLFREQRQRTRELKLQEQRLKSLFYQTPEAVFEFSNDGHYLSLNDNAVAITGINPNELEGLTYHDLLNSERMPQADYKRYDHAFRQATTGAAQSVSVSFVNAEGQFHEYECAFAPIVVDGSVVGVYAVVNDVSERYRAQEHQRLLTRSLETSDSGVLVFDIRKPNKPAVFVNSAFSDMTGIGRDAVLSSSCDNLLRLMVNAQDQVRIETVMARGEADSLTLRSQRRDGSGFWNQIALAPVRDEDGCVTHYTAIMKDVTEAREQESQLAYQATYDALTGLPNRAYFEGRLAHEMVRCQQEGTLLAVMFIDLDEFKPINDTLGHRIGDAVLVSIAQSINGVIQPGDTLARFGGDEFVLLLPYLNSQAQAEQMAQKVLERIGQVHRVGDNELYVTASIGISYLNSALQTPAKLLQQADIAMYKAKQEGRDTFVTYAEDLEEKLTLRVALRNDLQEAIKNNHLFLHYQPQVDRYGRVCGIEALVRWKHPTKGLISPASFIPIAEETGQIIHLGHWVKTQACRDARLLLDQGLLHGRMAVNLSPLQFHRPGFIASLEDTLAKTGLPPECLELELTESILMRHSDAAIELLKGIGAMGISTSIDDFGTGYSSFSYLKNLPVERVKIDRVFVENVTSNHKDAAVCQGIITMAGHMGITVVAEGVETQAQFEQLKAFGCDVFQGYRFARPMPFDELKQWLHAHQGAVSRNTLPDYD